MKKFEPRDTRDLIPFAAFYDELSIENVKAACEEFYHELPNSCDILASDLGHLVQTWNSSRVKRSFLSGLFQQTQHQV